MMLMKMIEFVLWSAIILGVAFFGSAVIAGIVDSLKGK